MCCLTLSDISDGTLKQEVQEVMIL